MILRNCSTNEVIAPDVELATSFFRRTVGLLSMKTVPPSQGIWFPNACMIHTVGMRSEIDVLFLDGNDRVLQLRPGIRPNRLVVACVGAVSVVELGIGALESADILIGDRLELVRQLAGSF